MAEGTQEEREIRAARNQSLFRAVNEKVRELNNAVAEWSQTQPIACECADLHCIEQIQISADSYEAVRAEPRRFVVLADHVVPDVEHVVREADGYVVVEKLAAAGEAAEAVAEVPAEAIS